MFQRNDTVSDTIKQQVAQAQQERRLRLQRAWLRYNGTFPKPLLPTKTDPKGADNIVLNLCRLVVDISTFFLFGKPVMFEVNKQKKSGDNDWLAKCWKHNHQATSLLDLGINGGVTGDAFIKVTRPAGAKYPRLIVLDPETVTAIWEPDDYQTIAQYRIETTGVNPATGKIVSYRQVITPNKTFAGVTSWLIVDSHSEGDSTVWTLDGEEIWPYPHAPIFHCKNRPCPNSFYGTADLETDVMDANEDVNFTLSNTQRILRIHGHPKTWARGLQAKDLDMSVDKITVIQSERGELQNLEMQSDLSSSREFGKDLKAAFHEVTSIPEIAAGKVDNIGQLSGLALGILYGPISRLTAMKQMFYGEMLSELSEFLLQTQRQGEYEVDTQWPNLLPKDDLLEAQAAVEKQAAGVSKDTTLTEMGYDAEAEATKRQDETDSETALGENLLNGFERNGLTTPPNAKPAPQAKAGQ